MWFILRMTFWMGVVLVLLPNGGSQPLPKSQVSASEAFSAAKGAVTDIQHFCERQQEACVVGSRTAVTLGQRAQAGAKMLYEFLSERFGTNEPRPARTTDSVPVPPARPSQQTLRPVDLVPPWRGPDPTDTPRDKRPGKAGDSLS
jgi:uncharacterized protein DUF5330